MITFVNTKIQTLKDILHIAKKNTLQEQGNIRIAKEILPWSMVEQKDHIILNNELFIQCIIAGIPPISGV